MADGDVKPPSPAPPPPPAVVDVGPGLPRHAGVNGYESESDGFDGSDDSSGFEVGRSDPVGALKAALEVDVTGEEFEWLATGAVPKPAPPDDDGDDDRVVRRRRRVPRCAPGPLRAGLFGSTYAGERRALFDPVAEAAATRAFRGRSVLCGVPLLSPFSPISRAERALVTFLDCTYSAFFVPIAIAYIGAEEWSKWGALSSVDLAAGIVFTVDIFFSLARAAVVTHNFRRRLLTDGRLVARAYAVHGSLWLDVLTVSPFWAQLVTLLAASSANTPVAVNVLLGLRALRLLRVVPAVARLYELAAGDLSRSLAGVVSTTAVYLATLIYTAAVLFNLLACVWFFVARFEGAYDAPPATTWLDMELGDRKLRDLPRSQIYVAAAYFSVTTLTTVGYGDIHAQTTVEHGVAVAVMFVGILFFSFVINSMGATLASSSASARRATALRAKFEDVDAWARYRRLPPALRRRIMEYYASVWVRQQEWREADLYTELPPGLRADVTRTLALELFRLSDLFAGVPDALLHDMAAAMAPVTVFPGHDLCEQGEAADGLWLMHEGELLLLRDGVPVDVVHAPALLGECVILADRVPEAGRRPVTMRAVELCTLWALPASRLRLLLDRCPDVEARVVADFKGHVRRYAARARRANASDSGVSVSGAGVRDVLAAVEEAARDKGAELSAARGRVARRSRGRAGGGGSTPSARTTDGVAGGSSEGGGASRAASGVVEALPSAGAVPATPFARPSTHPSLGLPDDTRQARPSTHLARPSLGLPDDPDTRQAVLVAADTEEFLGAAPGVGDGSRGGGGGGAPLTSPLPTWPAPLPHPHPADAMRRRRSSVGLHDRAPGMASSVAGLRRARSDRDTAAAFLVGEFGRSLAAARERHAAARAAGGEGAGVTGRRLSLADEFVRLEHEEREWGEGA